MSDASGCGFHQAEVRPATEEEIAELEVGPDPTWERMNAIPVVQPSSLGSIFDADLADLFEGPEFDRRMEFFRSRGIDPHFVSKTAGVHRFDDGTANVCFAWEMNEPKDERSSLMTLCYHDGKPHQAISVRITNCEWSEIAR